MEQVGQIELDMLRHQNKLLMQALHTFQKNNIQKSQEEEVSVKTEQDQDVVCLQHKVQILQEEIKCIHQQNKSLNDQNTRLEQQLQTVLKPEVLLLQTRQAARYREKILTQEILVWKVKYEQLLDSQKLELSKEVQEGWDIIYKAQDKFMSMTSQPNTILIEKDQTSANTCEEEEQDKESYVTMQTDPTDVLVNKSSEETEETEADECEPEQKIIDIQQVSNDIFLEQNENEEQHEFF